ncbi:bifunctional 2',3'-cyclic-nucleotide 2'-phosphodiesterase/3'-nucleotidase [Brevibacillus composti]|uniref:Bifunctional 2',3'-cyclic-nucleotide 2'-phosphodiesterase/3'-nucleotidase n=1 Tax=Brevibacillus composti TaxID=2796470 RepID=A0A7T5JMS8_9BACL|nr:bifunctional 2',3'-cyclic-nucleotide 2'-phosphodiesterase/3'-nucleotidase [Brevibacillus composti]QQE73275.1 bifunctional 2',3'-cyclic-nucleotide 2'-phosphodiesterase/3'-nucleotidase [Brevibacillus composti]QUO40356.1 bifunctional 2',3'-cyclic-nucleotide 2'-phosphodiesterase/3'-nucleotidase [Brevibacillus composti]
MKKTGSQKLLSCLLTAVLAAGVLSYPANAASANAEATIKLRLLETTDLHTNIVNYDYYQDKATDEFGLAKTASLIKQAREEVTNSMLFDNGDLIQGNPLGDYVAKINPLKDGETHPVYKAMNLLNYDAGNIGNHEFNFGLEHLDRSLKGSKFPYVNANVYVDDKDGNPNNDKNYFTPYLILDRTFKDEQGKGVKLKVGVIGFVPPQIMNWDKAHLEGKVIAKDIVETAKKYVPEMKKAGADLIVAIPHSGIGPVEAGANLENASYQLTTVEGIDAVLFGHSHSVFPGPGFDDIPGIDNQKGLINGKPAVMPGFWGNHLGIVDLTLKKEKGKWTVADASTKALPIFDKAEKKPLVDADPSIVEAVKEDHDHTVEWVRSAVGTTTSPIFSFFALVQDDPSIQIVTNAQKWFVEKNIKGTEYENIPVLSAGAPFKAGGRNGATYYTNIPAGTIAIKNVSDLYIYPNTLKAVLVNGTQLKDWLERSAGQFNQIDVKKAEEQALINEAFPTYNFDVIDGVTYQIDVTQPAKYNIEGKLENPEANRIKNLQYNGKEVKAEDKFIIVTNNYRASGGGNFPGADGSTIVIDSPDENRQIVIDYILSQKTINPAADNNWSFAPISEKVNVTFTTSPDAKPFAENMPHLKYLSTLESGFAKFSIDLSQSAAK